MNYLVKAISRPIGNRYYTGRKRSALLYAAECVPAVLICLISAIVISPIFLVVLLGIIAVGIIDYVVFDAFLDKLTWKLIWPRFYADEIHALTPEQNAMKQFEANPSAENYQSLQKQLKTTKQS
jgi:hypothetical protein